MKKLFNVLLIVTGIALAIQFFGCGSVDFETAKLYIKQGKYNEALPYLEKEVNKNPNNYEAWYWLGETKGMLKDYVGMNEAFERSLKISDKMAEDIRRTRYRYWGTHINNAIPYIKEDDPNLRDYRKALDEYRMAVMAWPDTSLTYRYMAFAYMGLDNLDSAIINCKKAWDLGKDTLLLSFYGRYLIDRGNRAKQKFETENAEKIRVQKGINEITKGTPRREVVDAIGTPDTRKKNAKDPKKEDWIYGKYGLTLTMETDKVVDKKITKVVDLGIDSTYYKKALQDFNEAVVAFETIRSLMPKDNENLVLLVQAYVGANRIKEATESFRQAVENEPNNKVNHYILAVLYRSIENYDSAIEEFKKALDIDPEYADAIYDIGATYYNWGVKLRKEATEKGLESDEYKKKFQEALPWLEKVTEFKSKDPQIWYTLGTIYTILGQKDKAAKSFDMAESLQKQQ